MFGRIRKNSTIQTVVVVLVALVGANGDTDKRQLPNKQSGLFPFPRVGRSDENNIKWNREINEAPKREKAMVFYPRIGRGNSAGRFLPNPSDVNVGAPTVDGASAYRRLHEPTDVTGKMHGRASGAFCLVPPMNLRGKRSLDLDENLQWALLIKEYPHIRSRVGFTPRLGRESGEALDYDISVGDGEGKDGVTD